MSARVWKKRRLRKARAILTALDGPPRCEASSGAFVGYRCDLRRNHRGKHEAVISRTTTEQWGRSWESARTVVRWS